MDGLARRSLALGVVCLWLMGAGPLAAQQEHDTEALAKQTQNPVADLVSIPFQSNFYTGGDLGDRTFYNLNIQPVIPFSVSKDWKIISRTILPFDSIPTPGETRRSGIGDIQEELFFTPATPGKLMWGFGPIVSLPTATASPLETGSWAAGPAFVVVKEAGPFVLGGLADQLWSFADSGGAPETNTLLLQPFVNFNFGKGWALSFSPIITANWDAESGNQWTVPLGLGITRTTVFNGRPMNLGISYYYNIKRPDGSGASQLRVVISLLYPTPKGK